MANPPPLYKFHLLLFIIFLQYLLCLHYLTSCFRRYILHDHFITQTMPAPASNYSLGSSIRPSRLASISYAFHVIYSTFPHRTLLFQYPYSLSPLYTPVKKKQRYFIQEYSYFSFCSSSLERTNLDCFGKFLQKGTPGKRMCLPWRRPFQNAKNP